jgi:hypothetical protein
VYIGDFGRDNTLLHIAAWCFDFDLANHILNSDAKIDIHAKCTGYGYGEAAYSVLSLASGDDAFVDLFIAHGANVWDPSNTIDGAIVFVDFVVRGNVDKMKQFIKRDNRLAHTVDERGNSVLHYLIDTNNFVMVQWIVNTMKVDTTVRNRNDISPLMIALDIGGKSKLTLQSTPPPTNQTFEIASWLLANRHTGPDAVVPSVLTATRLGYMWMLRNLIEVAHLEFVPDIWNNLDMWKFDSDFNSTLRFLLTVGTPMPRRVRANFRTINACKYTIERWDRMRPKIPKYKKDRRDIIQTTTDFPMVLHDLVVDFGKLSSEDLFSTEMGDFSQAEKKRKERGDDWIIPEDPKWTESARKKRADNRDTEAFFCGTVVRLNWTQEL